MSQNLLGNTVYLTNDEYATLIANGSVTLASGASIVYSENDTYIVPEVIDTTVTSGSTNPVTSGAIYTALGTKQNTISSSNKLAASLVSGLSTVATSGSYNDLFNKPTIPTVNNGKLTIQTEGTDIGTFTANQPDDTTINIKASDLGLSAAMKFLGTTTTAISDGSTTNPITISGSSVKATSGNVVLYGSKEFVWTGSLWEELGDEGSHALKTVTITGAGALGGGGNLAANRTITHNTTTRKNTTSTATPNYGGTFTAIDSVESDEYGHISKVNTKTVTLPADNNTWRGIQDNLSSTSTTDSLSAKQGKILNEGKVNKESVLSDGVDLNTVTTSGFYRLQSTYTNGPSSMSYGQLLVVHGGGDTISQFAMPYSSSVVYVRNGNVVNNTSGTWKAWVGLANTTAVADEATKREDGDEKLDTTITNHTSNTSNPHKVTAAQVGLGNVVNAGQSSTYIDKDSSSSTYFTQNGAYNLYSWANGLTQSLEENVDTLLGITQDLEGNKLDYVKGSGAIQVSEVAEDGNHEVYQTITCLITASDVTI